MDENVDFYIFLFSVFSEDLGISTKIPVLMRIPQTILLLGIKEKKLQFWTCFALYVL